MRRHCVIDFVVQVSEYEEFRWHDGEVDRYVMTHTQAAAARNVSPAR